MEFLDFFLYLKTSSWKIATGGIQVLDGRLKKKKTIYYYFFFLPKNATGQTQDGETQEERVEHKTRRNAESQALRCDDVMLMCL